MTPILKKTLAGGLAAAIMGLGVAASTTPAAAWGWGWGGAGFATGLAVGTLASRPYYGPYAYGPAYPGCYVQNRASYDPYGRFLGYRPVRVCY